MNLLDIPLIKLSLPVCVLSSSVGSSSIDFSTGMITFHRLDFQTILLEHLSATSCRTHTSKHLASYSTTLHSTSSASSVHLHFQDGTTATCDLLIGADGIKSVVRENMLRAFAAHAQSDGRTQEAEASLSSIDPVWSGVSIYKTTFPSENLSQKLPGHRALQDPMIVSKGLQSLSGWS